MSLVGDVRRAAAAARAAVTGLTALFAYEEIYHNTDMQFFAHAQATAQ